ncbi:MAG TPA: hypothetical protein DHW15_13485 [Bacteroidetes bacterium]|nr:hypothetical protein [Bacteroidota bacterium]
MKGSIQYYPWLAKLLFLIGIFLIAEVLFSYLGMYLTDFLFPGVNFLSMAQRMETADAIAPDSPTVHALQLYQVISSLGRFLLVPFLYCYLAGVPSLSTLGLHRAPGPKAILLIVPIVLSAAIVTGFVYEWNQGIDFPAALSSLESRMRDMEASAQNMTDAFLGTQRWSGLLLNLLIIGVVAAVSEEIIFRGLLQHVFMGWTRNGHAAIWLSAFAFSFIHLQFFGFFPRLLLGALLGYLYMWSGSLWTAIFGHFLNNSMAVVLYFLVARGVIDSDPTETGTWIQALVFLPIFALFMWQYYRTTQDGKRLDTGI